MGFNSAFKGLNAAAVTLEQPATYVLCAAVLLPIPRSNVNNVNMSPDASRKVCEHSVLSPLVRSSSKDHTA